jgi:hypothetical protein
MLAPFGYVVEAGLPSEAERSKFLLNLLTEISRVDPVWGGALNQAAVSSLANLTASYTFSEIELVVRRAFIRSVNDKGSRDPVALHHFEQILTTMPPQASAIGVHDVLPLDVGQSPGGEPAKSSTEKNNKKKDMKDPMDGIFGWCNFWLPEALHLPPVVWAMIIFGVLAHFMARSTYPPYGRDRKKNKSRSGLFDQSPHFAGQNSFLNLSGANDFDSLYSGMGGNMPAPPGMGPMARESNQFAFPGGLDGSSRGSEGTSGGSSAFPTAGEPSVGGPS